MSTISTALKAIRRSGELVTAYQQTSAAPKLLASYFKLKNLSFPFDIPLRSGGSLRVSARGEVKVFWEVFVHQCYRVWPDCNTVIDAGANIGAFSVWISQLLPNARILALEPHPETFAKLQHNLSANGLGNRALALQNAVAGQSGKRAMDAGPESQRRSLIAADLQAGDAGGAQVSCITLTDLLEKYNLPRVDLLKMDIEGSEWEALHSTPVSTFHRIRRLQFEYHEVHARLGYSRDALFQYLRGAGYKLLHYHEDEHKTGVAIFEQISWAPEPN